MPLHKELGLEISGRREHNAPRESNVCRKCSAALFGALTGNKKSADESNRGSDEFKFIVIPCCPRCEEKPTGRKSNPGDAPLGKP